MIQIIPMVISLPLIGFWFLMFRDMLDNQYLSRQERNTWTLAFVFINLFAAFWYYFVEYKNRNL
jgi:hypothetical protein